MPKLLVQSCSSSKREVETPTPAIDVYTGYFFKIIKKAMREEEIRSDLDICILSAKHGLLTTETEITTYDWEMDGQRARELRPKIIAKLQERVEDNDYDQVVVNLGKTYQEAIDGLEATLPTEVNYIQGNGIGDKGRALKRFVRGEQLPMTGGAR